MLRPDPFDQTSYAVCYSWFFPACLPCVLSGALTQLAGLWFRLSWESRDAAKMEFLHIVDGTHAMWGGQGVIQWTAYRMYACADRHSLFYNDYDYDYFVMILL